MTDTAFYTIPFYSNTAKPNTMLNQCQKDGAKHMTEKPGN